MSLEENRRKAKQLIPAITELRHRALELERTHQVDLELVATEYRASAQNLLHYLALRQSDIRPLQNELVLLGLTSLGRAETAVMDSLETVLYDLCLLAQEPMVHISEPAPVDCQTGPMMLDMHTEQLLGDPSGKRKVSIMVTMPSEGAVDKQLIRDLLAAGMDIMRINCAHDDQSAWLAMIKNLRDAERHLGRPCKVYVDMAGPKLRTGAIKPVGQIVKFRPRRGHRGEVVEKCRVWLTPDGEATPSPPDADVSLPITNRLLKMAHPGDEIRLVDTRGRHRKLLITGKSGTSRMAATSRTHYVETGLAVALFRGEEMLTVGQIGELPDLVLPIRLQVGDPLILTRADEPGEPARCDDKGTLLAPAHISCTLKEAFDAVEPGHRILFDDGKIAGRVRQNDRDNITVEITHAAVTGSNLRSEKGINFPDTVLITPSLTAKDLEDLAFMVKRADLIGLSFVRTPEDVNALAEQLRRLRSLNVGVVLKIETRQAFENLPRLLLAAMRTPPVGVMVARGDLAAEVGFERMAEVQDEILWFCEAAHIPVVWATQVLETLAKRGAPSRAEVTDVVMSGRAECVMLNKGPYIVETVRFLNGVLERMAAHRSKRRNLLRRLAVSQFD